MKHLFSKKNIYLVIIIVFSFSIYIKGELSNKEFDIFPVTNRSYLQNCLKIIDSAKDSILIAHFYFKDGHSTSKIKKAIRNAIKRKVAVKILLEDSLRDNTVFLKEISLFGAQVELDSPKTKLHSKIIIVDNLYTLIGSTNFSEKSINDNNETNVLISSKRIAGSYKEYFNSLWLSNKIGINKPLEKDISNEIIVPIFEGNYLNYALRLINNSRKKVGLILYMARFMPGYYSSKPNRLLRALCNAKIRGVEVKVIMEKSDHDEKLNEINKTAYDYLAENGIEVKFESPETITHAKLLLSDQKALLGSTNWVMSGLEKNNEADILINNDAAVGVFWEYFENLWKQN